MKKTNITFGLIALLFFCHSKAFAGDKGETPIHDYIIGTAQISCGEFVDDRRRNNEMQLHLYVQWAWGYMVAYNHRGSFDAKMVRPVSQISLPGEPTVLLAIEQYCLSNPTDITYNAVISLMKTLGADIVWASERRKATP